MRQLEGIQKIAMDWYLERELATQIGRERKIVSNGSSEFGCGSLAANDPNGFKDRLRKTILSGENADIDRSLEGIQNAYFAYLTEKHRIGPPSGRSKD